MLPYAAFTQPWNACGFPAMSVPAGRTADGLPVGLQLVGPPASEPVLLGLAGQLERALRWTEQRPTLV
jgi:Asp-tRNA(Asn)/Glu-tRNA(Gln) amidotransferase A subunit family amidase